MYDDFLQPHLVCHPDLEWAKERMPPPLAALCGKVEQFHDELSEAHDGISVEDG